MDKVFDANEVKDFLDEEEELEEEEFAEGSVKEMVIQMSQDLQTLKKEFEEYQREQVEFRTFVVDMLQHILAVTPRMQPSLPQSLLAAPKETPFITITYKDGTKTEEHVPPNVQKDWAKSTSTQELTRKVLLFLYDFDVAKLRLRRITERACDMTSSKTNEGSKNTQDLSQSSSLDENISSQGPLKEPLEERDILFVLEVVRKLEKAEEDERKFVSRVRKAIRESINYLYNYYGTDGNKLPHKNCKKSKLN